MYEDKEKGHSCNKLRKLLYEIGDFTNQNATQFENTETEKGRGRERRHERGKNKGSLRRDVFERRTSTGSEPLSLLMCLDATVFVLLSVVIIREFKKRRF